ncbi:MAG: hypothetical protein ACYC8V_01895 [Caulobacteraceae bacterium]
MRRSHPARAVLAVLGVALLAAVAASCLPDDPYQRFKLLDGTIYQTLRWDYERIHFDPRPVDVAIIGPSRTVLGLSAGRIEQRLSQLGKPANVANFSIIAAGRDAEWAIVNELYKTKSPKVIVIGVDETPMRYGHPAFKYIAPARAIAFPPTPLLHDYLHDLVYLPFRQMRLFAAWCFPRAFGLDKRFDPLAYARAPTDFTHSHRLPDGRWIEMDHPVSRDVILERERRYNLTVKRSIEPGGVAAIIDADDSVYDREIAREARAHGTRLLFVFMPEFDGAPLGAEALYRRYGQVLDNGDLSRRDQLFQGWAHFNHAGAMVASDRVANAIAPDL